MTLHFLANPFRIGKNWITFFIFWISLLLVFTMGIFHRKKCYQNASLYSVAVAVLPPSMHYRIMHLLEVTLLSNAGDNMYSRLIIVHHWMYFTWILEFPRMTWIYNRRRSAVIKMNSTIHFFWEQYDPLFFDYSTDIRMMTMHNRKLTVEIIC